LIILKKKVYITELQVDYFGCGFRKDLKVGSELIMCYTVWRVFCLRFFFL